MTRSKGRTGRPWRRVRAQVLAANPYCTLQLPGCTGLATEVDHAIPVSHLPADHPLLRDPTNLRSACKHCNGSRGDGTRTPKQPVETSRQW